jgi:hypothetical protein
MGRFSIGFRTAREGLINSDEREVNSEAQFLHELQAVVSSSILSEEIKGLHARIVWQGVDEARKETFGVRETKVFSV